MRAGHDDQRVEADVHPHADEDRHAERELPLDEPSRFGQTEAAKERVQRPDRRSRIHPQISPTTTGDSRTGRKNAAGVLSVKLAKDVGFGLRGLLAPERV